MRDQEQAVELNDCNAHVLAYYDEEYYWSNYHDDVLIDYLYI